MPPISKPVPRLRLRVTATAETIVRGGHPWLFAGSIHEQNRAGEAGELAVIFDRKDRFLAIGLFDPESPLRVRVLHAGKPVTIDDAWWRARLDTALARRRGRAPGILPGDGSEKTSVIPSNNDSTRRDAGGTLFDDQTTGHRWINGESDGWPGLVLDRYGDVLVLKLYTAAWLPRLNDVTKLIRDALKPTTLVLRLSRNIQQIAREKFQLADGQLLFGAAIEAPQVFLESGLRFEADVVRGQKTGFFLDQRENRRRVETFARGADVLNAFSFSSGFSLYAARGGAKSVTDLDISDHALQAGTRNFELNKNEPSVAACRHESLQVDVFAWLEQNTARKFDVVVLDPPSLAKRESERAGAIQAYSRLVAGGVRALRPNGAFVAASCSAHVSAAEFFDAVRSTAQKSGRGFAELATTGHAPDHPATFPEAEYLKCIYLRG